MKTESTANLHVEPHDALLIGHACARLCTAFVQRVDARDENLADLFVEDARLVLLGYDLRGAAEIRGFVRGLPRPQELTTLHFCGNLDIAVISATVAHGTSDMMYFDGKPTDGVVRLPQLNPQAIGTYHDEYRLASSGWLIARREFKVNFLSRS